MCSLIIRRRNMAQNTKPTKVKSTAALSADFLEGVAGDGMDNIKDNAVSTAYLGIVQPGSSATQDGAKPGHFRNSATGKDYGETIRVVPIAFDIVWQERMSEPPFSTVARYKPNTIQVDIKPVKAGTKGYPKMVNPQSGNEIKEVFMYAVILPDFPEDGVLIFNPNVSSMRACKAWNSQLKAQLLPNGTKAPIYAHAWDLAIELVPNPQQPANKMARLASVHKDEAFISKELFEETVKPQRAIASTAMLAIEDNSDEE